jgi:hypothetical protein
MIQQVLGAHAHQMKLKDRQSDWRILLIRPPPPQSNTLQQILKRLDRSDRLITGSNRDQLAVETGKIVQQILAIVRPEIQTGAEVLCDFIS